MISYSRKKLSPAEKRFSTTERECLAVIVAMKHFESYLRGVHGTIVTDHAALKWILKQKQPKGRIAKWVAFLQQFNYSIKHQPGSKIGNADGLSRRDYEETQPQEYYSTNNHESLLDKELDEKIFMADHSDNMKVVNVTPLIFRGRQTR